MLHKNYGLKVFLELSRLTFGLLELFSLKLCSDTLHMIPATLKDFTNKLRRDLRRRSLAHIKVSLYQKKPMIS
jgi:hypothetical protein